MRIYLIYIERKFIAIHREGLKDQFTVPAKKGGRVNNLKERELRVDHMGVEDTAAMRKIN